jgi:FMN phosphatase YigB (HAD superfamily)
MSGTRPKPNVAFFDKLVAASGDDPGEIAHVGVGDRLDNDIGPAARAGLCAVTSGLSVGSDGLR